MEIIGLLSPELEVKQSPERTDADLQTAKMAPSVD
jgi:hypothetical protein